MATVQDKPMNLRSFSVAKNSFLGYMQKRSGGDRLRDIVWLNALHLSTSGSIC